MHDRLARTAYPLLLAVLLLGSPRSAATIQVPETSLSRSLGMRPELVDDSSLLFQFPQRAGITSTRVFALSTDSSLPILGAHGMAGRSGFFLLAQPGFAPIANSALLQAGWGISGHGVRLGLAGRANHYDETSNSGSVRTDALQVDSRTDQTSIVQGSFGLGFGNDRTSLDLAVDVQWDESKSEELDLRLSPTEADTSHVLFDAKGDLSVGAAARFHGHFGNSGEIMASGSWHRVELPYEGELRGGGSFVRLSRPAELEHWSAALGVAFSTDPIDWLALSASARRIPQHSLFGTRQSSSRQDLYSIGFSMRQKIWRDLEGQAGILMLYEMRRATSIDYFLGSSGIVESRNQTDLSRLTQAFSWGATYVWRNFDIRALLKDTFDPSQPFVSLDLFVHL